MTRINVVPVEELSDQWLIAEYHELPRCIKQDIDTKYAPPHYKLGKGHMKWAKKHSLFLFERYNKLCMEMKHRGFTVNYSYTKFWHEYIVTIKSDNRHNYLASILDKEINISRLIEKYKLKPNYYTWTKRSKPYWIQIIDLPKLKTDEVIYRKNVECEYITTDKCTFWKPAEPPKELTFLCPNSIETLVFKCKGKEVKIPVDKFFNFLEDMVK